MGKYQLIEYRPNRWIKVDRWAGVVGPATPEEVEAWQKAQAGAAVGHSTAQQEDESPIQNSEKPTAASPSPASAGAAPPKASSRSAPQKPGSKPKPAPTSKPGWRDRVRPLAGRCRVTSTFADHRGRTPPSTAPGIDLACAVGTDVRAWAAGKVIRSRWSDLGGRSLWISHDDGIRTYYAHLSSLAVLEGESVSAGQKIAESGDTGHTTGPHLHFAVVRNGEYVDPDSYLPGAETVLHEPG
jgi:murein DD-endopeptidase MepM/ murein hydrolase activator NlpD